MKRFFRRVGWMRPSPALVVACIALLVALGGTGYAVTGPASPAGAKALRGGDGIEIVEDTSAYDSSDVHTASAVCPPRRVVVGGGFRVDVDSNPNMLQVQYARPFKSSNSFEVWAYEDSPYADDWGVVAVAVCAKK